MNYKFDTGDYVKIVAYGHGCSSETLNKVVKIIELSNYNGKPGYLIDNDKIATNRRSGQFNGIIGEASFELVLKARDVKYLKTLVENPDGGNIKKDQVGKVVNYHFDFNFPERIDFSNHCGYYISSESYKSSDKYIACDENGNVVGSSDFNKPVQKDLKGRYIQALVDRPNAGAVKKGEIGIIKSLDSFGKPYEVDFPSQSSYTIIYEGEKCTKYRILPESYSPDKEIKQNQEYIPKVGDIVKINFVLNNNHYLCNDIDGYLKLLETNQECIITRVGNRTAMLDSKPFWVNINDLEHAITSNQLTYIGRIDFSTKNSDKKVDVEVQKVYPVSISDSITVVTQTTVDKYPSENNIKTTTEIKKKNYLLLKPVRSNKTI